jgi:hypothetical protein
MHHQLPFWRGKGEGFGRTARLISRIFFQQFPGDELRMKTEQV